MKNLKRYNEFILSEGLLDKMKGISDEELKRLIEESDTVVGVPPERDEKYEFLVDICERVSYGDYSKNFFVKQPIEIGMADNYKLFLNYLSVDNYDNRLSYWFIYNEQPDKLHGTSWNSGVIWEENGLLKQTDQNDKITLYPDFIDIIYNEIKSYNDLDKWIEHIIDINKKRHGYRINKPLSWEERLDRVKNDIEYDKLLNRYSKPYDEKILKDMEELGQEKFDKKQDELNDIAMSILKDIE